MTTKIMTLNLANYDDNDQYHKNWPQRLNIIASVIINKQPDVIAVQEVRFKPDEQENNSVSSTKVLYQNMGEQVLWKISQDHTYSGSTIVTQPAMFYTYDFYSDTYSDNQHYPIPLIDGDMGAEWEGISIISRLPVIETGSRFLKLLTNTPVKEETDPNKRITQYAAIQTMSNNCINLYNCHFSYNMNNFISNINETVEFMKRFNDQPCILLGDLNKSPQEGVIGYKNLTNAGLYDLWELLYPGEDGYTAPFDNPPQRIDYIWANSQIQKSQIKSIELVATTPVDGIYASDHYGLLAEIDI